jgi:hypothetical protein
MECCGDKEVEKYGKKKRKDGKRRKEREMRKRKYNVGTTNRQTVRKKEGNKQRYRIASREKKKSQ